MKYVNIKTEYKMKDNGEDGYYILTIKVYPEFKSILDTFKVGDKKTPCRIDAGKKRNLIMRDISRIVSGSVAEYLFCDEESFELKAENSDYAESYLNTLKHKIEEIVICESRIRNILTIKDIASAEDVKKEESKAEDLYSSPVSED